MNELFYNVNDTLPRIEVIVSGDGAPIDLTDSTGNIFYYKGRYSGSTNVLSGNFSSKSSGMVYVDLTGNNTISASAGPLWGKFLIYFQNGGRRSYPQNGYINIEIISGA